MSRHFHSSLSRAAIFLTTLTLASAAASAPPPSEAPQTSQSAVALEFLKRLENGQYGSAHLLLDDLIRRRITVLRLRAARPPGLKNPTNFRVVRHEGAVRPDLVRGAIPSRRYYAVCMSDRPQKGSGGVGYVAVTLSKVSDSAQWRVFDFRFQSDIPVICR